MYFLKSFHFNSTKEFSFVSEGHEEVFPTPGTKDGLDSILKLSINFLLWKLIELPKCHYILFQFWNHSLWVFFQLMFQKMSLDFSNLKSRPIP